MSPHDPNALYYLGLTLERQLRPSEALDAFHTALRRWPGFPEARQKIASYSRTAEASIAFATCRPARSDGRRWRMRSRADEQEPAAWFEVWDPAGFVLANTVLVMVLVGLLLALLS